MDSIPSADVPLLLSFSLISSYASASKNILLVGISSFFICLKSWYPSSTSIRLTFPPLPWASLPTSPRPYLQPTPGHESIWIHMNFSKNPNSTSGSNLCFSAPAASAPSNAWPLGTGLQLPSEDPNSWRDFVAPPAVRNKQNEHRKMLLPAFH